MFKKVTAKINRLAAMTTLIIGVVLGIIFWGGFNWSLAITNTESFCISCHEMKDFVYEEYKDTIHYNNRTGVRATCPDCHVPKEWKHKIKRKIQATNELFHKMLGTINTKEKFESHRLEMALRVWENMKSTGSRECRNCHNFTYMDFEEQDNKATKKHKIAAEQGKTCVDCHKGIAHELPDNWKEAAREKGLHE